MIILIAVSSALYLALGNHFWHQIVLSKWLQCANDSDHDVLPSLSRPKNSITLCEDCVVAVDLATFHASRIYHRAFVSVNSDLNPSANSGSAHKLQTNKIIPST